MMTILRRMTGGLLLLVALICFGYPYYMDWQMRQRADDMVAQVQEQIMDEKPEQEKDMPVQPKETFPLYQTLSAYNQRLHTDGQQLVDAWSYQQEVVSFDDLPNGEFGSIEIPDMGVSMPLYLGASEEHLSNGAAVLSETSIPIGGINTNAVISGHRGWYGHRYFQDIQKLTVGSLVYIHNPWETLTYRAVGIDIIDPYDIDAVKIQPDKDMITLLTCHPIQTWIGGGTYRYLVYCERVPSDSKTEQTNEPLPQIHPNAEIEQAVEKESASSSIFVSMEPVLRVVLPVVLLPLGLFLLFAPAPKSRKCQKK